MVERACFALAANGKKPFVDVSASEYFSDAVQWAVDEKMTNGTSTTTFSPCDICTQAQIITMIWRSYGCSAPGRLYEVTNIKEANYYYSAVRWARDKRTLQIGNDIQFLPNVQICDHDFRAAGGVKTGKYKTGSVEIGSNVRIGTNTIIVRGIKNGDNAVIAAGSIVKGDIPEGAVFVQKKTSETR